MSKIKIEINGSEYEFRFDMYAIELCDTCHAKGGLQNIVKMVYAGIQSAFYAKQSEAEFSFEDAIDLVDELTLSDEGKEKIAMIDKCLAESKAFKTLIKKRDELEEAKKKLTGTESTHLHLAS